jgi:hypothetical protein
MFHVKQSTEDRTLSLLYARLNLRREAAGFILRMFRLSERRPRGENAMFRPSFLNLFKRARMRKRFSMQARASRRRILFQKAKPENYE